MQVLSWHCEAIGWDSVEANTASSALLKIPSCETTSHMDVFWPVQRLPLCFTNGEKKLHSILTSSYIAQGEKRSLLAQLEDRRTYLTYS